MNIQVDNYEDLKMYIELFKNNTVEILIIEGKPGVGKTHLIKEVFQDIPEGEKCFLEGRITAPILYEKLYMYCDYPIILDDCDGLYKDKQSIELLKSLCQTEQDKKISWNVKRKLTLSSDPTIELPSSFYTGSQVCIICNQWKLNNQHIRSISDRGILLSFNPTIREIHKYAKHFCTDSEVYTFIEKLVQSIKNLSFRSYKISQDIKNNGYDFKPILLNSLGFSKDEICVIQLLDDSNFPSMMQKAQQFSLLQNRSERSFYRIKKEIFP